ncbi:MAG TPA: hypothetical protein VM095_15140 [Pyrinomonadaceae bacterium]|nr:hypothetical protein [Pyrinomonadaceae bacterium]
MKHLLRLGVLCSLLLIASGAVSAQPGLVCGNPQDVGCRPQFDGFKRHELAFLTGRAKLGTGTRHESAEFYAVILQSVGAARKGGQGCNYMSEKQRLAAQRLFPANKVFVSRNHCRETLVYYENTNNDFNFLAVYGGETEAEAGEILIKARRRYPQANIRKIRVVLDFADE